MNQFLGIIYIAIILSNSFSTRSTHSREDSMGEVTRGKDRRRRILDLKKSVRSSVPFDARRVTHAPSVLVLEPPFLQLSERREGSVGRNEVLLKYRNVACYLSHDSRRRMDATAVLVLGQSTEDNSSHEPFASG